MISNVRFKSMGLALTAACIIIGNELLSGKVQEANLIVLAQELRRLGVRLQRVVMIEDNIDAIASEVKALSTQYSFVFTSGGIGPTHDDVTLAAVAQAFGMQQTRRPLIEQLLKEFYGEWCTEAHLRMADIPEETELLPIEADAESELLHGRKIPWPTMMVRNVFVLPGIPQIFRLKLDAVYAYIKKLNATPFFNRSIQTNMDEGHLKPLLDKVVSEFHSVEIGSYPAWLGAGYRTKITFDGRNLEQVEAACEALCTLLPEGQLLNCE